MGTLSPNPWDGRILAIPGHSVKTNRHRVLHDAGLVSPLSRRSGRFPVSLSSAQARPIITALTNLKKKLFTQNT